MNYLWEKKRIIYSPQRVHMLIKKKEEEKEKNILQWVFLISSNRSEESLFFQRSMYKSYMGGEHSLFMGEFEIREDMKIDGMVSLLLSTIIVAMGQVSS